MAGKWIKSAVVEAFDGAERDDVRSYLDAVRVRMGEQAAALRRMSVYIVLVGVFFELATHRGVERLSLGPAEIVLSNGVVCALPVLLAYFTFEGIVLTVGYSTLVVLHRAVFKRWNATAESRDLDRLLEPQLPLFWSGGIGDRNQPRAGTSFEIVVREVLTVGAVVGCVLYQVRVFTILFLHFSVRSPLVWTSLAIVVALLALAIVRMAIEEV